jgi:hypothetical protein
MGFVLISLKVFTWFANNSEELIIPSIVSSKQHPLPPSFVVWIHANNTATLLVEVVNIISFVIT